MKYVLALDQGTTSSRAILFDGEGAIAGVAQQELPPSFPRPGWVEHDPEEIWSTQSATAIGALRAAGVASRDVAAIGITNQRETTIVWDRATGEPIHPAIVWQDRRTVPDIERLRETGEAERIRARTGLVPDAYFSASKIRWLLDRVPGARERAARGELAFGTVDSWLVFRLTGGRVHATDVSNASRTMLFGLRSLQWDEELLRLFDVPRSVLPEVRASSGVVAEATEPPELAGIPIAGIAGDQQAALFGQLAVDPGRAKCTYGTGCFLLLNTGEEPVEAANGILSTVAWRIGDRTTYAMEGSVFIGGAVVQWLRDGLGIVRSADEIEALAASVPDSGGVYLVPAFAGLGAPHWDPRARGTICGLTRGTTSAHLARAALESIAFQVADLADAMATASGRPATELRVDGGAAVNDLLMQIQADLLGVPVVRPRMVESTALGAALLAGIAAGVWRRAEDVGDRLGVDRRFAPARSGEEAATQRAGWRRALERAMDWER